MRQLEGRSPRVLVVGDGIIDQYLWGASGRISPEAPVPVVDVARENVSLGGAGNVAANLLALGAQVSIASVAGDDLTGRQLLAMLQERGVDTRAVVTEPGRQTSHKTRLVAAGQQVVRFDRETREPVSQDSEAALLNALRSGPTPEIVLVSDYNKGVCTPTLTRAVIHWAVELGVPVLIDPKGSDWSKYRGATLVTPNRKEAAELTGLAIESRASLERAGQMLRDELGLRWAIITLSEDGMAIFDHEMTHIHAAAREVYDVTGAGDTVLAMLGFALGCGATIVEAAHLANRAAAVVVGKLGSATVTLDEIITQRDDVEPPQDEPAIQSIETIGPLVAQLRGQGQRIVFTNGCFDLLHRGHVEYLRASRSCGDVLVVGINSDESVRRLKGPRRPIIGQDDRAYLLAALRCVDYVVIFDDQTPQQLIERIRPDVLTKGADYAGKHIVGSEVAGQVRLISLVKGCGTSVTIDRILEAA